MQTRPFFPALVSLVCAAFSSRAASDKLAIRKLICKTPEHDAATTTFHDAVPLRSRGSSPKYGAYFRSRSGRIIRSHHNPKYRKKLRYAHA